MAIKNRLKHWAGVGLLTASAMFGNGFGCGNSNDDLEHKVSQPAPIVEASEGVGDKKLEQSEANKKYHEIVSDKNIPGIESVVGYEAENAKHCLVHMRQKHFVRGEVTLEAKRLSNPDEREEKMGKIKNMYDNINNSQKGIEEALIYLGDNHGLRDVMLEGLTNSEDIKLFKLLNEKVIKYVLLSEVYNPENVEDYQFIPGAVIRLGMDGKINVLPAEDDRLNDLAKSNHSLRINPREDHLLGLVGDSNKPYSVVVFGGKHDFLDNVRKYNEAHPDDRISLIVMTPKHYGGKNE